MILIIASFINPCFRGDAGECLHKTVQRVISSYYICVLTSSCFSDLLPLIKRKVQMPTNSFAAMEQPNAQHVTGPSSQQPSLSGYAHTKASAQSSAGHGSYAHGHYDRPGSNSNSTEDSDDSSRHTHGVANLLKLSGNKEQKQPPSASTANTRAESEMSASQFFKQNRPQAPVSVMNSGANRASVDKDATPSTDVASDSGSHGSGNNNVILQADEYQ
jgi:hypothetical protein